MAACWIMAENPGFSLGLLRWLEVIDTEP